MSRHANQSADRRTCKAVVRHDSSLRDTTAKSYVMWKNYGDAVRSEKRSGSHILRGWLGSKV